MTLTSRVKQLEIVAQAQDRPPPFMFFLTDEAFREAIARNAIPLGTKTYGGFDPREVIGEVDVPE